jgi:type IV pilus assembly protein PilE
MRHIRAFQPSARPGHRRGFTLFELLITMVVIAILAGVALPSYQDSVMKGRRADAVAVLTEMQQALERFRASNPAYADNLEDLGMADIASDHYSFSISNASATGYTLTAEVKSTSAQLRDQNCRKLLVRQAGGSRLSYDSANSAGVENTTGNSPCWAR